MFCRFIKGATLFDNFYTTPQCAQTRAAVLTGRHHVRTGTMLVSSGEQPLNAMQNAARLFTVGMLQLLVVSAIADICSDAGLLQPFR